MIYGILFADNVMNYYMLPNGSWTKERLLQLKLEDKLDAQELLAATKLKHPKVSNLFRLTEMNFE